jgi:hypothetical protein
MSALLHCPHCSGELFELPRFAYAGAKGKADPSKLERAKRTFCWQPKLDGIYLTVCTDGEGKVSHLFTRAHKPLTGTYRAFFEGLYIGAPHSVFAAEGELWTEAANRVADTRGWRKLHLFDCLQLNGEPLAHESYSVRRGWLERIRAHVKGETRDRALEDSTGCLHGSDGRFVVDRPNAWRRYTVVPQLPLADLDTAWRVWVDQEGIGPCEGLVAVSQENALGTRGSKLKYKRVDTLDAVVVMSDERRAVVTWQGLTFTVGRRKFDLSVGTIVEVKHEGFYETSCIPRFPRLVRVRRDLQ